MKFYVAMFVSVVIALCSAMPTQSADFVLFPTTTPTTKGEPVVLFPMAALQVKVIQQMPVVYSVVQRAPQVTYPSSATPVFYTGQPSTVFQPGYWPPAVSPTYYQPVQSCPGGVCPPARWR